MLTKEMLLRSKDVAHMLDMSPDDVVYLAKTGNLSGSKEGRYWRFTVDDVRKYKKLAKKGL